MAWSLLVHAGAVSTDANTATTSAIDTTGADFLVMGVPSYQAEPILVSDSKTNTWTARTSYAVAGDPKIQILYVNSHSPIVGSGHTFQVTLSAGQPFPSIYVAAFKGSQASPYDAENGAVDGVGTATSKQPGSITPSQGNSLIIAALCVSQNAPGTATINSGFTILDQIATGINAYGGALAYLVQASAAAINPTWTFSASTVATTQAAFRGSSGLILGNKLRPRIFSPGLAR